MKTLRVVLAALCSSLFWFAPDLAQAQYPDRPIRIVVGFTPGGGNDIIARVFGQKLSESLGQPVIIENKPGAGAMLATEYVARSAPDGYTLLVGASGAMTISPAVYEKINYDTMRDFKPVSSLGSFPPMQKPIPTRRTIPLRPPPSNSRPNCSSRRPARRCR
jgi:tripartite-type tricarboxylate transporter receptor subunit TctC